jgi:hypothetical protein
MGITMKRQKLYYGLFALAALIYIIATLLGPLGPNRFDLSPAKTRWLQATIALPVVLIWFSAVYGALKFKNYTSTIQKDADGRALDGVATGLSVLVASYIINGTFGTLRAWATHDGWLSTFTIISNYLAVALALVAFTLMYRGSNKLAVVTRRPSKTTVRRLAVAVLLAVIAGLYVVVMLTYNYRSSTPDASRYSSFYLPDALILLTLVVPYLVSWACGMLTCFNISAYQRHVKGVIYRSALRRLAVGTMTAVLFSILLQMLIAFSTFFARQGLAIILLIVYLIIIMYGAGFLIIASGARRLSAIEKVK